MEKHFHQIKDYRNLGVGVKVARNFEGEQILTGGSDIFAEQIGLKE